MTILVVPRETHHESALLSALERAYAATGYPVEGPDAFPTWLYPTGLAAAWTALHHDVPVGQLCLTTEQEVCRLYVDPLAQGHGAGTALLQAAMSHAADQHATLHLTVLDKDVVAIRLYTRLGWTPTHRTTNGNHHGTVYTWRP